MQLKKTITTEELIKLLEKYPPETKVITNSQKLREYLLKEAEDFILNSDSIYIEQEEAHELQERVEKIINLI